MIKTSSITLFIHNGIFFCSERERERDLIISIVKFSIIHLRYMFIQNISKRSRIYDFTLFESTSLVIIFNLKMSNRSYPKLPTKLEQMLPHCSRNCARASLSTSLF